MTIKELRDYLLKLPNSFDGFVVSTVILTPIKDSKTDIDVKFEDIVAATVNIEDETLSLFNDDNFSLIEDDVKSKIQP